MIRYFLSAAVTMMTEESDGWRIPPELLTCIEDDGYGEGFDPDEAYGEPEYLSEDDFDDKDSK